MLKRRDMLRKLLRQLASYGSERSSHVSHTVCAGNEGDRTPPLKFGDIRLRRHV